jgi:hypothetical protein
MKNLHLIFFILFLNSELFSQTCSNNLLQNPGFESDLTNWAGTGGSIGTAPHVASGTKSLKMCTSGEIRRQTLAATAGKTYRLQYNAKTAGTGQNILFGIKFFNASWLILADQYAVFDSPTGFSSNFIEKLAPTGTVNMEITILKQNAGCVYIDDLCLTNGNTNTGDCTFGLVGHYTFEGNANDISGKQNNGTLNGPTLTTDRLGVANKAYHFDGNDYIEVPNSASLSSPNNQITISGWVLNENPTGGFPLLCKSDLGFMDYRLQYYGDGRNELEILLDGDLAGSYQTFPIGEWFHVAVTSNAGVYKFYKNGDLVGTTNEIPDIVAINKLTNLFLGFDPHSQAEYHIGSLDEIRIYDCALSETEVLAIYNAEKPQPPSTTICTGNLLQNPSFESNLINWDGTGGSIGTAPNVASGAKSLKMCTAGEIRRQTLNATAGKTYRLQYSAKTAGAGQNILFGVKFFNAGWQILADQYNVFDSPTGFTTNFIEKTAPAGTAHVEVSVIKSNAGCIYIDDLCLTESGTSSISIDFILQNFYFGGISIGAPFTTPNVSIAGGGIVGDNVGYSNIGQVLIKYFISTDQNLSSDDALVYSRPSNYSTLTPSTSIFSEDVSGDFVIPSNIPNGNYFLIGFIDADAVFPETNEINNTKSVAISIQLPPQPPTSCVGNLLPNPGFESDLTNWDGTGGTIGTAPNVASGAKSLKMCTAGEIRRQTLNAIAGKKYRLQYAAKTAGAGQNVLFGIKFFNSNWQVLADQYAVFDSPTGFTTDFIEKIAPSGTVRMEISVLKPNSGCVYVDDMCLTESTNTNDPCSPDVTAPEIANCPTNITQTTTTNIAIATWNAPTTSDNCSGAVTLVSTHLSGASFPIGSTTVTYTAKDAANNTAFCAFTITVTQQTTGNCAFGLVGHYTFDGNANDISGKQNNGTLNGPTLTTDRLGVANKAFHFDGNDYIEVQNSASISSPANQITISSWVLNENTNGGFPLLCKSDLGFIDYRVQYYGNGRNELEIILDGDLAGSNQIFPVGEWFHVAVTSNLGVYKFFKNGALVGTVNEIPDVVAINKLTNLYLGFDPHSQAEYHLGSLDEIRIYDCALSETEVLAIYNAEKPQPTTTTCTGNLLQNPSFESDLNNWDGTGGTIGTAPNVLSGTKSLKMCTSGEIRRQTLVATAGKTYRFAWNAKTAGVGQNILFGIKFFNSSWQILADQYAVFDSPTGFTTNFIEKMAPAGTVRMEISINKANAGCVFVDDMCLTASPNLLATGNRVEEEENIGILPNFKVFPNPASESVFIKMPSNIGKDLNSNDVSATISLLNQVGLLEKDFSFQSIENEVVELDLSEINNGIYFLKIEVAGQRPVTRKLVVSRMY